MAVLEEHYVGIFFDGQTRGTHRHLFIFNQSITFVGVDRA